MSLAAQLGLPVAGLAAELDSLGPLLRGPGDRYTGLVHSDACPDNEQLTAGRCRILDFETSGWGPFALDAAYLLAPFPSCWCFGALPAAVSSPAVAAYRAELTRSGLDLGADWDVALTAALGGFVVARAPQLAPALEEDRRWGTTTIRPRLLAWLASFTALAATTGALPRLRALAGALHSRLTAAWPEAVVPDYPALARPGRPVARWSADSAG